jgi:Uma2 family endonuclease
VAVAPVRREWDHPRVAHASGIHFDECLHLPRGSVRFPIELIPPPGFRADDPQTWPAIDGSLEYVDGRLLYMPPSGDVQQDVCSAVTGVLFAWIKAHAEFVVGSNEAGMILGGDTRGADAAVWRRADARAPTGRYRRTAPVLAVEVAGAEQHEAELRDKARWYLDAGVELVWIVLPESREVVVLSRTRDDRLRSGERLAPVASLPDLQPEVAEFFLQLDP